MPTCSVTFQVRLPMKSIPVFLLTPGPNRWKLWNELWSEMAKRRSPGLACLTVVPSARLSEIVAPGPTVPWKGRAAATGGNGERSCDHEADENGTACHLVHLRPGAANGFLPA